jgi:hypothetical protein
MCSQYKNLVNKSSCITVNSNFTAFESNFLQILALLGAQTPGFSSAPLSNVEMNVIFKQVASRRTGGST